MELNEIMNIVGYAQVIATLFVAVTIYIYWRQVKVMESQLRIVKDQTKDLQDTRDCQLLYEVINSLLKIKDDIERVLALDDKSVDLWTKEEHASASTVCARFHLVGILIIKEFVPASLFSQAWYYSVPECHRILQLSTTGARSELINEQSPPAVVRLVKVIALPE